MLVVLLLKPLEHLAPVFFVLKLGLLGQRILDLLRLRHRAIHDACTRGCLLRRRLNSLVLLGRVLRLTTLCIPDHLLWVVHIDLQFVD